MTTTSPRVFDLPAMPAVLPSFVRAALSVARHPAEDVAIPAWTARLPGLSFDRKHLADYNALCGFARPDHVPMTYPQALATPLFLHLMTQPGFPLPLLGLVHIRNAVEQRRELRADDTLDLEIRIAGSRPGRSGLEIDLEIELSEAPAEVIWRATMTVLRRSPAKPADQAGKSRAGAPSAAPEIPLAQYLRLDAPADIGRRYAALSQDYNPIHLYAGTARLFGFPRAIAHGLWSAARTLALLEPQLGLTPRLYDVQFKQPLLLPGRATLRLLQESSRIEFALLDTHAGAGGKGGSKVHLTGTLR